MNIWEILVPTVMPEGKPIRTRQHRVWDEKVRKITGGLTVMPPVRGQWVSPDDELFLEQMIPVRIACTREQIREIAVMTIEFYEQQAVMYYRISSEVYTLERKNECTEIIHRDRSSLLSDRFPTAGYVCIHYTGLSPPLLHN